ncbi:glycosyltransferase family 39 protein [Candidatus Roizmanbacteria bacterium]|nr:MAG: glycosyltransferase family 39 protein [Candidatus Roizmanbacteria bacterium]
MKFIKQNKLVVLFFVAVALLRLWKVPEFFSFNFDEEYQASMAWEQVKDFHPIWIGVSASNIEYYLGPGFTYLNAFLFKLSNGDPVILAWFSSILGLVTAGSIYYTVRDLFGKKPALISMTIYGASAFLNFFDRRFWNPTPIPIITIWLIYSLIKGHKDSRWYLLTMALYAAFYHVHLSLMLFVPIIAAVLFFDRKKIQLKKWLSMAGIFYTITLPLLVFDFVHNFDNMLGPIKYLFDKSSGAQATTMATINAHVQSMLNALGKIWFMKPGTTIQDEHCLSSHCSISEPPWILVLASLILLGLFIRTAIQKKDRKHIVLLSGILTYAGVFTFYSGYAAEYFLLAWYVMLSIAFGIVLSKLPTKLYLPILAVFVIANGVLMYSSKQEQYGLLTRKQLVKEIIPHIGDKPFELETYGTDPRRYHSYGGWRFLFKVYGETPERSFADESFGWIYPDELTGEKPVYRVVVTDTIQYKSEEKPTYSVKRGAYYGYVYENK